MGAPGPMVRRLQHIQYKLQLNKNHYVNPVN